MPVLYIDGDSCHVLEYAESIAEREQIECHIFCDTSRILNPSYGELHIVGRGRDAADFAILKRVEKGDIVVTNDSGLSSMVLAKKGIPINSRGIVITEKNVMSFLNSRHIRAKEKNKTGKNQVRGLFTDEKHENKKPNFSATLVYLIRKQKEEELESISNT